MTLTLGSGKTIEVEIEEPEHFTPQERAEVAKVMIRRWRAWGGITNIRTAHKLRNLALGMCQSHRNRPRVNGTQRCQECLEVQRAGHRRRRLARKQLALPAACPDGLHDVSTLDVCACGLVRIKQRR